METKFFFQFRGCLANLVHFFFEREKYRTQSSQFRVLALSPVFVLNSTPFFEFAGRLVVSRWIRKDFTQTFGKEEIFN